MTAPTGRLHERPRAPARRAARRRAPAPAVSDRRSSDTAGRTSAPRRSRAGPWAAAVGEPARVGRPRPPPRDVRGDLADARQRRIEAALVEVRLRHLRASVRAAARNISSVTRVRAAGDRAQADAGEDVGVVALARHERLARRASTGSNGLPQANSARPSVHCVGLLRGALRLRGRVGQREHDRPLVDARHRLAALPA